ncbi:hypothetical protein Slin15195_G052050 [Septoria linicola]|uniref:Uncharacterized protein n=1 Tax=Septoria linicola TaxID=215465 RepID=A0A9Q9EHJ7_9PEZI|nr:hypothetical protein Slin14017_G127560 [Septoria linicola]USW51886.1 hypothetical protein Slin15195_G052050 [Septoria linicola]
MADLTIGRLPQSANSTAPQTQSTSVSVTSKDPNHMPIKLQCFTLKRGFKDVELGVGVRVQGQSVQSEFDLLSLQASEDLRVRTSIQGLPFSSWLPLPLAQSHWTRVRKYAQRSLDSDATKPIHYLHWSPGNIAAT